MSGQGAHPPRLHIFTKTFTKIYIYIYIHERGGDGQTPTMSPHSFIYIYIYIKFSLYLTKNTNYLENQISYLIFCNTIFVSQLMLSALWNFMILIVIVIEVFIIKIINNFCNIQLL